MPKTIADIKKRLNELEFVDGQPIEIILEVRVSDSLTDEGELVRLKRLTINSDGSTTYENLL